MPGNGTCATDRPPCCCGQRAKPQQATAVAAGRALCISPAGGLGPPPAAGVAVATSCTDGSLLVLLAASDRGLWLAARSRVSPGSASLPGLDSELARIWSDSANMGLVTDTAGRVTSRASTAAHAAACARCRLLAGGCSGRWACVVSSADTALAHATRRQWW